MKIIIFALLFMFFGINADSALGQSKIKPKKNISLSAGMGIDYGVSPEFTDYLRDEIPFSNKDSIKSFQAGIEFFGGVEYELSQKASVKLDYSYFIRSLNYTYSFFVFDYTITSHQPYLFVNYLIKSENYAFKFGFGAGYHFQLLDNKVNQSTTLSYNSSGVGIRGEAVFSTKFSKSFWGYLSGFTYGNFYGKLKDSNGNVLKAANSATEANLSGYGIGARLGFSIILN